MAFEEHGAERGSNLLWIDPEEVEFVEDKGDPLYDPRAFEPPEEDVVLGMMEHGVIKPTVMRKAASGRPTPVDGRRRTVNLREANRRLKAQGLPPKKLPFVYSQRGVIEAVPVMIIANMHRTDDTVMQRAEKARRAIAVGGYSEEQVASMFRVSPATIKNWLVLIDLHPKVQEAVNDGKLRLLDAVREVAKVQVDEQPAKAAEIQAANPTRRERKERGSSGANGSREKAPPSAGAVIKRLLKETAKTPGLLEHRELTLLRYIAGAASGSDLVSCYPQLESFIEAVE